MTFERWLQARLNAHGARLVVDGDIGRATIAAIRSFQEKHGLRVTGVADAATVKALRQTPLGTNGGEARARPGRHPPAVDVRARPPHGPARGPRQGRAGLVPQDREVPRRPGALALVWRCRRVRLRQDAPERAPPSNPFFAQNWAKFGRRSARESAPSRRSGGMPTSGHVGFVSKVTRTHFGIVGGNQSNGVSNAMFPLSKVMSFRWPLTFPITNYPTFTGATIDGGGVVSTR
jgi:hypothetical protein